MTRSHARLLPGSLIASSLLAAVCAQPLGAQPTTAATPIDMTNPFLAASSLPFQAPPFDRIKDSDFQPAIEEGMRRQMAEVTAIAADPAAPTFDNTIVALERTGDLLTRVNRVFNALGDANTNDTIQGIQSEMAPKLAAHRDGIFLDGKLFARVKSLYDGRDALGLDAEGTYLVERYYRNFVRAGAQLSEADKTTLRALNQEESTLATKFHERVLGDTNASALVISDRAELDGLSDGDIAAAAEAAKERGLEGKWVLALLNTTQQPALASLRNRVVRERLLAASTARGNHGGDFDTTQIVARLAQLRAQRAKLLGFPSYAAYALDDQMAKTPEAAVKLLTDLVPAAVGKARGEAAKLQAMIDTQPAERRFPVAASDWDLYSEQVRKAEYDLDASEVRPYFALERVLQDGVFFAAHQMYGLSFKERKDIPVYHPDVRVFEVFDADGSSLALFYADYYARPSKSGGAWMDTFVDQSRLLGTKPVVFNVCNFAKPAAGETALLSFDDVSTIFHEFGHALHGMFQNVEYPTLSNVPRDYVEFPSQFNEHWALEPTVFANFAKHYQTGAPIPQALVEKIKKSRTFNQGYATTEYLAAALLDIAWHTLAADAPLQDAKAFETAALARFHVDFAPVPPRYHTTYFNHIWGGGYSSGYYAYLWAEVIDDDAYAWFEESGGMTRANGQRFRDLILSRGGSQEAGAMYRAFRGKDPSVEPLLRERGLEAAKK
jgi:peptidyl-dipeptidase Dcp